MPALQDIPGTAGFGTCAACGACLGAMSSSISSVRATQIDPTTASISAQSDLRDHLLVVNELLRHELFRAHADLRRERDLVAALLSKERSGDSRTDDLTQAEERADAKDR